MARAFMFIAIIVLSGQTAVGHDLGTSALPKTFVAGPAEPPAPTVLRQGGDTIDDAFVIASLPFAATGSCVGYDDNYDWSCPMASGPYPDVVYAYTPAVDQVIDIDLCGTFDDTALHVFYLEDSQPIQHACNIDYWVDDICGVYVSRIPDMPAAAGVTYYIVVHGFWHTLESYEISVTEYAPCDLECPGGAALEGEPPLENGYLDHWNGGCATGLSNPPIQALDAPVFCGVTGFYLVQGNHRRDTDWFSIEIPAGGVLEIIGDAQLGTFMFELGPLDCDYAAVLQSMIVGPCNDGAMTITGVPGSLVWIWVGPTTYTSPDGSDVYEYEYVLRTNLNPVATENYSWTGVRTLFR